MIWRHVAIVVCGEYTQKAVDVQHMERYVLKVTWKTILQKYVKWIYIEKKISKVQIWLKIISVK